MSVHYKFKSALDYDTVTFDGLHISVGELKSAISQQKRIGKTSDFDLQITNAQTKEVYSDDHTLIPKNTSLLVARVPLAQQPKKQWHGDSAGTVKHKDGGNARGAADLSRMEGSEQDKINAMISQSTLDYDPSNYQKIRGQNQSGVVPLNYRCHRCHKPGHWIKNCPINAIVGQESVEIRRSTGIPLSFMVPVDGPKAQGAMMTPTGNFAVPVVDHEAYRASESGAPTDAPPETERREIPDDLICSLCQDLLTDAVMIPCCGNSFCDECIRGALLDSEDHECPDCREKEIAPTTLIPNRFLRNSVSSFRNQTGYSRRMPHRRPAAPPPVQPVLPEKPQPLTQPPPNGQTQLIQPIIGGEQACAATGAGAEESDGSCEDNITVTVPPPSGAYAHHAHRPRSQRTARPHAQSHLSRYGPPHSSKPHDRDMPPGGPRMHRVMEEQRASTPTVDENRDPVNPQMYNRPPMYGQAPPVPGAGPPPHFAGGYARDRPPSGPYGREPFPPDTYQQPPPPGIKLSPTLRRGEDPLEAFNRMIREKEERAKRRETERRRAHSPSPRSPPPRSPPPRSPPPRSPPPRSPPPRLRSPRSRTRSPPLRLRSPPSRASSRVRYSRSRSASRGRRRTPQWSPRRRRTRERTLSLTRSPSPRRRRSPPRYRSPLRSPPPRARSPPQHAHRPVLRTPPTSPHHHHRYGGGFEERTSPHRRNVEPPYGPRYGPRNNGPPPSYPSMGVKPIPSISDMPMLKEPSPGFRSRYEEPPFEDIPPGAEPPVPGYEPPPFDNPMAPPGMLDHDRLAPINFREPPFHRGPYVDAPQPYRDMPPVSRDQPLPPYREGYRGPMQQPPFREPGLAQLPYRDGQPYRDQGPPPQQFRDNNSNPNYRGGPPPGFRDNGQFRNNMPYRDGPPPGYRDNQPPHGFRDGPNFRPPNIRDPMPGPLLFPDANREGFREVPPLLPEVVGGRDQRGYRQGNRTRGGPRRNFDDRRDRERPDREPRDRYDRDNGEKPREERKMRDERNREYDRNRDMPDKDREERGSPDRKRKGSVERTPPRRRDNKDKTKSESRGRSKDREGKRDKKDEKERDRSSEKIKDKEQKEKERKVKERKKKKKEKEEKKKKKEKREKKDKDEFREEIEKEFELPTIKEEPQVKQEPSQEMSKPAEVSFPKEQELVKPKIDNDLYSDVGVAEIDKEIMESYIKTEPEPVMKMEEGDEETAKEDKDSSFEGLDLQAPVDDPDLKTEETEKEKEVLAPIPELSKWEMDDESALDKSKESREPGEISPDTEISGKVTSEVIKRAENAIFAKAINSIKTIEIKKISTDRLKLYADGSGDRKDSPINNIQITLPVTTAEQRIVDMNNDRKQKRSKTPPQKLSIKDRLGGKIEEPTKPRDERYVHSIVERIKSRSKTPKREHPYRRVTVDTRDHSRRLLAKPDEVEPQRYEARREERRVASEGIPRSEHAHRDRSVPEKMENSKNLERHKSPIKDKVKKKEHKPKKSKDGRSREEHAHGDDKGGSKVQEVERQTVRPPERDRKRSLLDEANFEPDYDEHLETDTEGKEDPRKKRERSKTPANVAENAIKRPKTMEEVLAKRPGETTDTSSDSDSSSSSSSSEARKKKRKKRKKRKKKKAASDSDSESYGSSSDEPKKKKKKKHKKKSSKKKKKKSKHK